VDAVRCALVVVLSVLFGVQFGVQGVPAAADSGPWGWPVSGPPEMARGFDLPASRYGAGHRGVDLPAAPGSAVLASAAGRVTYAGLLAGRGVVVVTHGALRTTYEPVAAAVRVGAVVSLGEVVGQLEAGHSGCPAAACLHWGLRRGEEYLDPARLVERGPVRLLPLDGRAGGSAAGRRSAQVPAPAERAGVREDAAPEPAPVPAEVAEPSWSLRAAEAPLGAVAVVALVLGVGLLARPRPLPPAPVSGGLAAPAAPAQDEPAGPPGTLLDLDAARVRRAAS
jgi:murein DD-endopeptidase MepM/ murein hydrolase activator NlpD